MKHNNASLLNELVLKFTLDDLRDSTFTALFRLVRSCVLNFLILELLTDPLKNNLFSGFSKSNFHILVGLGWGFKEKRQVLVLHELLGFFYWHFSSKVNQNVLNFPIFLGPYKRKYNIRVTVFNRLSIPELKLLKRRLTID